MTEEAKTHQAQESHFKSKAACLSFLCGYWFLVTYNSDPPRFTILDLLFFTLHIVLVLSVQAYLLSLAKRRGALMDAVIGFFIACNFFALYVTFAFPFLWKFVWYAQAAFFVLVWLFAMQFFSSFAIGRGWRKLLVSVTGALFAFQIAVAVYFHVEWYLVRQQALPEQLASSGAMTSSPNVRLVEFTQTPNVYFISFDGMLPETLASELLDIPSLEYERTLEENGFLRFSNYFSDAPQTQTAFARLFAFDPQHTYSDRTKIVGGLESSPLREIFHSNGYRIHMYTKGHNIGPVAIGSNLDSYVVANILFSACTHMNNKPDYVFFGFCNLLAGLQTLGYTSKNLSERQFVSFMLDDLEPLLKEEGKRYLFFAYVRIPEHFYINDGMAKFREKYKRNSVAVASAMEEIVVFVRKNDPDALLYFFSDHGSLIYSGENNDLEDVSQRLRVLDNYGGLGAFYPPQACEDHFVPRQWSTTSMISRDIVRCLAGGVDPFVNEVKYQHVDEGIDVTDYLYE